MTIKSQSLQSTSQGTAATDLYIVVVPVSLVTMVTLVAHFVGLSSAAAAVALEDISCPSILQKPRLL